jgi:acetyl-CoA acetyltransferase
MTAGKLTRDALQLTPNGGAVAIAHPFGATGTRYVLTLATELRERNARYGASRRWPETAPGSVKSQ